MVIEPLIDLLMFPLFLLQLKHLATKREWMLLTCNVVSLMSVCQISRVANNPILV